MKNEVYVINSGKGGVGKTTVTANVGTALAMEGHRVLLIDADIGLRNLDLVIGLENRIVHDIVQVIEGVCKPEEAMIQDKHIETLYLLPAAQTRDKDAVTGEQVKELCENLKSKFDYILIDSPAGIDQGFQAALAAADHAVVVTTPDVAAIRDADRVIGYVKAQGLDTPDLILNRVRPRMVRHGDMMATNEILDLLSVKLMGLVPEDDQVIVSTNRGMPVVHHQKSRSAEAFRTIAARLDGREIPVLKMEKANLYHQKFCH